MIKNSLSAMLLLSAAVTTGSALAEQSSDKHVIERGRYIVSIAGCNDCHTPGYPESDGNLPQSEWLTGNSVGFSGPWGTTYPANLRLLVQSLSVDEWLSRTRKELRPPMPWFALRDMSEADRRAVYHFIRSLGAKGKAGTCVVHA